VKAGSRPASRRWSGEAIGVGLFAAIQTFVYFARRDRFSVLFWWTGDSWSYVSALWLKDLALAALAFVVFAEIVRATLAIGDGAPRSDESSRARDAVLFGVVLAAGILLRWIAPRAIPPGVWSDILIESEGALRHPGDVPWLGGTPLAGVFPNSTLVSNLYLQWSQLLLRIFGRGDVGILSLSAVGGTLTLPAVYWLAREALDRRRALVATAIAALGLAPLVVSRWGWTLALLLPLLLGAAAAALAALRTGRLALAVLSGALLGLTLHTHAAAWAASAGFAAWAVVLLRNRAQRRLVAAAAIACVLAAAPYVIGFVTHRHLLGGRARDVSFLAPTKDVSVPGGNAAWAPPVRLLYNAVEYTGLFLWTRDPNPRDGLPGRSPFTAIIGVAALAGVAVTIRKARDHDRRSQLLLFAGAAILLAGILGNPGGAPNLIRVYPFVGIVAIWAAVVLDRWLRAAAPAVDVRAGFAWALVFALVLVFETVVFLTVWPRDPLVVGSFCPDETAAGRTRRALGDAPTYIDPAAVSWPIVFETLAAPADPSAPVPLLPRRTAAELVAHPPAGAAWYLATEPSLAALRAAGWRCARGIPAAGDSRPVVLARIVPRGRVPE
jgi:hypothetical protein